MVKMISRFSPALSLLALGMLVQTSAKAQCVFTPTITPSAPVMCPGETDTLWTQSYDAYQWYKEGVAISGATQQFLIVNYGADAGSSFSVAATQGGCTEISASVLVDGWAFLPPFVSTYGNSHLCPGDTVILQLMSPYTTNIKWYRDGALLSGATDDSLIITEAGSYTASGAPAVCPFYEAPLGLDIPITASVNPGMLPTDLHLCNGAPDTIHTTATGPHQWYRDGVLIPGMTANTLPVDEPGNYAATTTDGVCALHTDTLTVTNYLTGTIAITLAGGDLFASVSDPEIGSFQWYLDGEPIPGATAQTFHPVTAGSYTVLGVDNGCDVLSEAYAFEPASVGNEIRQPSVSSYPNPVQGFLNINAREWVQVNVYDLSGKLLLTGTGPGKMDVTALPSGSYLLRVVNKAGFVLLRQLIAKQ